MGVLLILEVLKAPSLNILKIFRTINDDSIWSITMLANFITFSSKSVHTPDIK